MKQMLTLILILILYCSVSGQNYISEEGTSADSFRVGSSRYFTLKLDLDSNFVEVNVNGYLKRIVTRDMLNGISNYVKWNGETTSDPLTPGSGTVYYNSVNDLFKIYTEGEGTWLTFLFSERTYSNPAWISSLAWSKITSKPTSLSGYGITDGVSTSESYSNPSWLTSLAWSKISSKPTTLSGYGITDGVYWRGEAISDPSSPGSGTVYYNSVNDQYKIYTEGEGAWLTFLFSERTYSNPAWLSSLAETKISFTDVTTGNASSSMHGFLPKLANTGTKFLRDDGTWQTAGTGDVSSSGNNEYSGTNAYNNDVKFSDDWIRTPEAGTLTSWGGSYALDVSGKNFIELNPAGNRTLIYLTDEGSIDGQIVTIQNISSYDITINEDDNILFAGTITSMVLKQYGSATFRYRQTGNYWICIAAYPGT